MANMIRAYYAPYYTTVVSSLTLKSILASITSSDITSFRRSASPPTGTYISVTVEEGNSPLYMWGVTNSKGVDIYYYTNASIVRMANTSGFQEAFYDQYYLVSIDGITDWEQPQFSGGSSTNHNFCYGCSLTDIPSNLRYVWRQDFYNCDSLTNVYLPHLTIVSPYSFYRCSKLKSVSMPNVTSIGDDAFYYCVRLISVSLSEATSIGYQSFEGCVDLTSVLAPKVTSLGGRAFYSCSSLTSVSLPNVISIGDTAFHYCKSLTAISLPKATAVHKYAFEGCNNLTAIHFASANKSAITALSGYTSTTLDGKALKFGATNATIYFDL